MIASFAKLAVLTPPGSTKIPTSSLHFRSAPSPKGGLTPGNVPKSLDALTGAKAMNPGGHVVGRKFLKAIK